MMVALRSSLLLMTTGGRFEPVSWHHCGGGAGIWTG